MAEDNKEQASGKNKIIIISVASGFGALLLAFLIWSAIFSSQFAVYKESEHHISIKYPRNWTVVPDYAGTIVTFASPKEDALDTFQESLNISAQDVTQNSLTLEQFTQIAMNQMNAVFKENITTVESRPITFAGFPAYRYVTKATNPDGVYFKFVWFIKDGQAYTITCTAQLLRLEKYAEKFDEMLRSFSILAF